MNTAPTQLRLLIWSSERLCNPANLPGRSCSLVDRHTNTHVNSWKKGPANQREHSVYQHKWHWLSQRSGAEVAHSRVINILWRELKISYSSRSDTHTLCIAWRDPSPDSFLLSCPETKIGPHSCCQRQHLPSLPPIPRLLPNRLCVSPQFIPLFPISANWTT